MQINVNSKLLSNDSSAHTLIKHLENLEESAELHNALVYHDFPFYLDEDGESTKANVLLVSEKYGIFIFESASYSPRTYQKETIQNLIDKLEHTLSQVYSKLIRSKLLRESATTLNIPVHPALFIYEYKENGLSREDFPNTTIISTKQELASYIRSYKLGAEEISKQQIKETIAILEGSKTIVRSKKRKISGDKSSKGSKLEAIETDIAVFDEEQKSAALKILDGPQRIRGLAGSGKTVILAMKAAQIHLKDPSAIILYTFWTKNLYGLIKRLITRFYRTFADRDPDWDKIHILHAWGGKTIPGVYYNTCIDNEIMPASYRKVMHKKEPFNYACETLSNKQLKQTYDYVLLDEAQDFPINYYRICRKIVKDNRIIWGFDEAQNILNIELQDTRETFGRDTNGEYFIDLSRTESVQASDIVLHICYRNPRKNLVCAFALGLGIYNDKVLQIPENNDYWEDLGFQVIAGNSEKGDQMVVDRPSNNSPLIKNELLEEEDTVTMGVFKNMDEECDFVSEKIKSDIEGELLPSDIMVIALDNRNARKYFKSIEEKLSKHRISTYNHLTAPSGAKIFSTPNSITLTTVYRAKGNEAGSVYVIGIDAMFHFHLKDSINQRNKLFTAITRSIAWVTLTGIGEAASLCKTELNDALAQYPMLVFEMPDKENLKILQRDLSKEQEFMNRLDRDIADHDDIDMDRMEKIMQGALEKRKKFSKN